MVFSQNPDTRHPQNNAATLEDSLNHYGELLAKRHAAYDNTLDALAAFWDKNQSLSSIEAVQGVLQQTLSEKYAEIQALLKQQPPDEKAMDEALHSYNITLMNLDSYQDMADVASGKKRFCGEDNEDTSFAQAKYVLAPDKKVLQRNGVRYLVGRGVNSLNELSPLQLKSAQQDFEKAGSSIIPTRQLVKEQCTWEKEFHSACLHCAQAESTQQKPQLTDNHERAIAAAQSSITAELNKANPNSAKLAALSEVRMGGSSRSNRINRKAFNSVGANLKQALENLPPPGDTRSKTQELVTANNRSMQRGKLIAGLWMPPYIVMRLATRAGNTLSLKIEDAEKPDEIPKNTPRPRL